MNPICDHQIDDPAAWTAEEIGGKEGVLLRLAPGEIAALEAVAERTRHLPLHEIRQADSVDPILDVLLAKVRDRIMHGRGAVILSGFDMAKYSVEEFSRLYWIVGAHFGRAAQQSEKRDWIGFVRKEKHNPTARGYMSDIELRSHTDFHELLSLACTQKAAEGGESGLVSSLAIHNVIQRERPDLLAALYEGFYHESVGEQAIDAYKVPVYCYVDGLVSCYHHPLFMFNAAKTMGVELPPLLLEGVKFIDEVSRRPGVRADFLLEPGEMMFWHNFLMLHSRTFFVNGPGQERCLLRLWLNVDDGRPMDPAFRERAAYMDKAHAEGRPGINYAKALAAADHLPKRLLEASQ